jgi:hypothetical protein
VLISRSQFPRILPRNSQESAERISFSGSSRNRPAEVLLEKLRTSQRSKASGRISAGKALSNFGDHLQWLMSRHIKKPLSDEYLAGICFGKIHALEGDAAVNAYCRVHLAIAADCFSELAAGLVKRSARKSKGLKRNAEIIRNYLFDLKGIAEHLEQRKNPGYQFLSGAKNDNVRPTWQIFQLSRQLIIGAGLPESDFHHSASKIAAVFVLRQALEAKFGQLVAVDVYNSFGQIPRLKHDFHYEFIADNPAYFSFKAVDFALLKKIYDWCNEVINRLYQPYAWQIAYAHKICSGLFDSPSSPSGGRRSTRDAVEIDNATGMQLAFMDRFISTYPQGIWALEAGTPEANIRS